MAQRRGTCRKERRATVRADARLSMRVQGAREDGNLTQVVTESQNISASGVYCYSPHYLPPLSRVDLAIVLPRLPGGRGSKDIINCEGIVVRCESGTHRSERQYQLACMFTDMDPKRRQRIEEYVTWRNLQALRAATATPARRKAGRARAAAVTRSAATKAGARRSRGAAAGTRPRRASGRRETAH